MLSLYSSVHANVPLLLCVWAAEVIQKFTSTNLCQHTPDWKIACDCPYACVSSHTHLLSLTSHLQICGQQANRTKPEQTQRVLLLLNVVLT